MCSISWLSSVNEQSRANDNKSSLGGRQNDIKGIAARFIVAGISLLVFSGCAPLEKNNAVVDAPNQQANFNDSYPARLPRDEAAAMLLPETKEVLDKMLLLYTKPELFDGPMQILKTINMGFTDMKATIDELPGRHTPEYHRGIKVADALHQQGWTGTLRLHYGSNKWADLAMERLQFVINPTVTCGKEQAADSYLALDPRSMTREDVSLTKATRLKFFNFYPVSFNAVYLTFVSTGGCLAAISVAKPINPMVMRQYAAEFAK